MAPGVRRLTELRVRGLGVIDDVTIDFDPGMTVLTGETGAGKTLLIEALALLLGGRADPSVVRDGSTDSLVEGRFVVDEGELDDGIRESEVVLARSIATAGRSKAWVDGRMAPLGSLAETGSSLVELHGQHQHRSLVHTRTQRDALDDYGNIDLTDLRRTRLLISMLSDESVALGGDAQQRARDGELLRYQIAEIEAAHIVDVLEDDGLETEEDRLSASDAHREAAATALEALSGSEMIPSALDRLADVAGALAGRVPLAGYDVRARAAMADLGDLATDLRNVVDTWEDDPERLDLIRKRRERLYELRRKYGGSLDTVLEHAESSRSQLEVLAVKERRGRELDAELAEARSAFDRSARAVADARRTAAPRLAAEIQKTLRTLAMPMARFEVTIDGDGPADQVCFWLGSNPGEPVLPLAKVASGGELARTMLAVRLALTNAPGVLVFDEVDAGVGGEAANAVGAALADLGRRSQVLVVTHLAQVAARADHHMAVRKVQHAGRTRSEVEVLESEERVVELSRMLSGSPDSNVARAHARELLNGSPDNHGEPGT
jgi:DNA repair protein RecN (Recombination protein N)